MTQDQRVLYSLKAEIRDDLAVVSHIAEEIETAMKIISFSLSPDLLTMMGLAALVHHYYSAIESLFLRIIEHFDGKVPSGEQWHKTLLVEASRQIPELRPPIISKELLAILDNYRRFRHLFRHLYELNLDWELLTPLLYRLPEVHDRVKESIAVFADFIDMIAANSTEE